MSYIPGFAPVYQSLYLKFNRSSRRFSRDFVAVAGPIGDFIVLRTNVFPFAIAGFKFLKFNCTEAFNAFVLLMNACLVRV